MQTQHAAAADRLQLQSSNSHVWVEMNAGGGRWVTCGEADSCLVSLWRLWVVWSVHTRQTDSWWRERSAPCPSWADVVASPYTRPARHLSHWYRPLTLQSCTTTPRLTLMHVSTLRDLHTQLQLLYNAHSLTPIVGTINHLSGMNWTVLSPTWILTRVDGPARRCLTYINPPL